MKHRESVLRVLLVLLIFVFLHSFMPSDPRARMGFKPFQVEWEISREALFFAVKKWRHILWFAIFFPLVRLFFTSRASIKALFALLVVTVLIEVQQGFIAGRHARVVDLIPNLIGAALGAWAWHFLRRQKSGAANGKPS